MERRGCNGERSVPATRRVVIGTIVLAASAALTSAPAEEPDRTLSRSIEPDPRRAAAKARAGGGEVFHMRWNLGGFLGTLAGLFVPSHGDALLTFVPDGGERTRIGVLISAPRREGEYFLYGADIATDGSTRSAWDSYVFRGERKEREQTFEQDDVIDIASAIQHLRRHPPRRTTRMRIWNGGKFYPVEIEPLGRTTRSYQGNEVAVRGYSVRGVRVEGEGMFKDKLFLYFALDDAATPLEIVGRRSLVRVRLRLVDAELPEIATVDASH